MGKKIILLADDTEFFLELEKSFFRRDEFDLRTARTSAEVLEIIASVRPDVVFLDLYMPGMSGDECCRRIKDDPKSRQIPVIIVTVSGKEKDMERCRKAGCDDIILKPINRQHFIETAKKYLNLKVRSLVRYMARLQIHFGKDAGQLLSDYIINLSTGGVFLETTKLIDVDTPLEAEFVLPRCAVTIRCKARVAWVNHPASIKNPNLPVGMGLQFVDLGMDQMDAIRDYIRDEKLSPMW